MAPPDELAGGDQRGPVIRDQQAHRPGDRAGQGLRPGRSGAAGRLSRGPASPVASTRPPGRAGRPAWERPARPGPAPGRGRASPATAAGGRRGATRRLTCRPPSSSSPSAPPTCSGCRPSTPTTASGSSATGRRCASRRWPTCSPSCCRCSTTSAGPASTASSSAASRPSPRRSSRRRQARARELRRGRRPVRPELHEALMHAYSADVTEPTCVQILQPGYRSASGSCARPGSRSPSPARPRLRRAGRPSGPDERATRPVAAGHTASGAERRRGASQQETSADDDDARRYQ